MHHFDITPFWMAPLFAGIVGWGLLGAKGRAAVMSELKLRVLFRLGRSTVKDVTRAYRTPKR